MAADLGIAIGAGTDVAIDSADAVLVRSDLLDAVSAIRLSRSVMRNIKENLFWAFFYNVIGIPLAAGVLYPAFGIKLSPDDWRGGDEPVKRLRVLTRCVCACSPSNTHLQRRRRTRAMRSR